MAVTVVETVLLSVHSGMAGSAASGAAPRPSHAAAAGGGRVGFRVLTRPLPRGTHPDALARRLAGLHPDTGGLLHSTSWRFDFALAGSASSGAARRPGQGDGAVVLTYAALPDPTPAGAIPLDLARSTPYPVDPLAPGQVRLTAHDVAVHACRHLSYLRRTDPLVARAADDQPELWEAIDPYEPGLAGALGGPASWGTTVLT